jgi:hypothetical protein
VSGEDEIRDSLINTLFNMDKIAKAHCFRGKSIEFSFSVGRGVPLPELVSFVERQSAYLAQQIARIV